ncbi:CDP-glycerol glycerophosphotransferase family protein [Paenibacillus sp. JCM 10914]|uniref:hypothetical protein n=1 Tax=Paenibacillus sp. JCM 10914 TaxID=1236974 RepID=UPI0003CC8512|nr:hypothetical protein [Paenibacillus sp. JCM 10914]GAE09108.1 succinyl-CoA ligase [Paenibacillus sp. JCM 10914]
MRKQVQLQIMSILPTILEGVNYAVTTNSQQAAIVLGDCYSTIKSIMDFFKIGLTEERFDFYQGLLNETLEILENIHEKTASGHAASDLSYKFKKVLRKVERELEQESEVKIEVVFMPYKSSMWDSLESIWLAAKEDKRCNPTVIPIPYYDKHPDGTVAAIHYEGGQFPDQVPIVHYDNYDLSSNLPDIIYIHNPYDDSNRVTSVDPRYYSHHLKQYTNILVYVPYFISGVYANVEAFAQKHLTSCLKSVDQIVVQSHMHKKLYSACGVNENKLLVLGSPKLDSVKNMVKEQSLIPTDWIKKMEGKKAVVLNSSIGSLLVAPNYLTELKQRISIILSFNELFLIWRPHPLLKTTISSMRPALLGEYNEIIQMVQKHENAVLDQSGGTLSATIASCGMISDTSSWARQYIATGKPVLMLQGTSRAKNGKLCVFDHFSSYFLNDGYNIEEFCRLLISGEDEKKAERLRDVRNSIVNTDGSCGKKVNHQIISLLR